MAHHAGGAFRRTPAGERAVVGGRPLNTRRLAMLAELRAALEVERDRRETAETLAAERAQRIEDLRRLLPPPNAPPTPPGRRRWWWLGGKD